MHIAGQLNGVNVELERPEPSYTDNIWYEAVEYRVPRKGENYIGIESLWIMLAQNDLYHPQWIMQPIPRATPEQLKDIRMRERDTKPVWCEKGDIIWTGNCASDPLDFLGGRETYARYRWVLVSVENLLLDNIQEKLCLRCSKERCSWNIVGNCRDFTPKSPMQVVPTERNP